VKHFWNYRNELIDHSDVVYLVDPNILNKAFFKLAYLVSLMLFSHDHTAELKLNLVLFI